jgi:hypothetical protein
LFGSRHRGTKRSIFFGLSRTIFLAGVDGSQLVRFETFSMPRRRAARLITGRCTPPREYEYDVMLRTSHFHRRMTVERPLSPFMF